MGVTCSTLWRLVHRDSEESIGLWHQHKLERNQVD